MQLFVIIILEAVKDFFAFFLLQIESRSKIQMIFGSRFINIYIYIYIYIYTHIYIYIYIYIVTISIIPENYTHLVTDSSCA